MEKLLNEKVKNKFAPQIIIRGENYYNCGKVEKCFKTDEGFISRVNGNFKYIVKIHIEEDEVKMSCTCPCTEHCKHEYATLMAIDNAEYKDIDMLPSIGISKYNLVEFVNNIPSEEFKKFVLSKIVRNNFEFEEDELKDKFIKYLVKEDREYFYNNIYNSCVLDEFPSYVLSEYIEQIRKYVDIKDFSYVFLICSSIIDAICDSKILLSSEKLMEIYNNIGIFIRISYRRGEENLKQEIQKWITKYDENNFNDDVYLEDMLLSIK